MDEEFDVEKYRREHPMDYILAMRLIIESSNKDEVFKTIYKISRLHIPDTLYKYFSFTDNQDLNNKKLDSLLNRKLFLSDSKNLNDPFDNKGYFYRNKELMRFKELIPYNGKMIDDFSSLTKVTSLTNNSINCMPMWAHYSNNHKGFCVSYHMNSECNQLMRSCTYPVQYVNERVDITDYMIKNTEMVLGEKKQQILRGNKKIIIRDLSIVYLPLLLENIKHSSWSYEQEFRCAIAANAQGSPFIPATPSAIYAGIKCEKTYLESLIKLAKDLDIPLYQMIFDECSSKYEMSYRKIV